MKKILPLLHLSHSIVSHVLNYCRLLGAGICPLALCTTPCAVRGLNEQSGWVTVGYGPFIQNCPEDKHTSPHFNMNVCRFTRNLPLSFWEIMSMACSCQQGWASRPLLLVSAVYKSTRQLTGEQFNDPIRNCSRHLGQTAP